MRLLTSAYMRKINGEILFSIAFSHVVRHISFEGRSRNENTDKRIAGKCRVLEMDQWDKDFIALTGEGHITFAKRNRGDLHFGAVDCDLDYRIEKVRDQERIEFSLLVWTRAMKSPSEDGRHLMERI